MSISDLNERFIHNYQEFVSQNSLTAVISGDFDKITFILYTARRSFKGNRFFPSPIEYFPTIYSISVTEEQITHFFNYITDSDNFTNIFKSFIKPTTTDVQLCSYLASLTPLDELFNKLLYFFIFTNNIAITSIRLPYLNKGMLFKVSHSEEKEREFYNIRTESKILYHGTDIKNVYSIMRNGFKSMSGTEYMTNGAVHGDGIYLSDSSLTATNYGREIEGDEQTTCVLIFNSKNLNMKSSGYCYVQQESECILRCILWINSRMLSCERSILENISEYANKIVYTPTILSELAVLSLDRIDTSLLTIPNFTREPLSGKRVVETGRFKKEIINGLMLKRDETFIRSNFLIHDNIRSAILCLVMPDLETDLAKDLIKYNIPGILLAIYLPEGSNNKNEYPFKPPRIRVISPMLIDGTGRVTKGGSICADILYPEGWSPASLIEGVIRNIIISIATEGSREGPGRVDPNRLQRSYQYDDYVKSFSEVAGYHSYTAV